MNICMRMVPDTGKGKVVYKTLGDRKKKPFKDQRIR